MIRLQVPVMTRSVPTAILLLDPHLAYIDEFKMMNKRAIELGINLLVPLAGIVAVAQQKNIILGSAAVVGVTALSGLIIPIAGQLVARPSLHKLGLHDFTFTTEVAVAMCNLAVSTQIAFMMLS